MDDVDKDELAALRERAYGSGAEGLSDAEAGRLRALEERSRSSALGGPRRVESVASPGGAAATSVAPPVPVDEAHTSHAGPDSVQAAPLMAPESGAAVSGTAKLLFVVAAALIPVAAVGGFLAASAFGEAPAAVTPTALAMADDVDVELREQQRAQVTEFQEWDDDVTFWGAVEDLSLWWGTADGTTCVVVVLDAGGAVPICADSDAARAQGIREEVEFFHVESDVPGAEGLIDVTDVPSTRVVFAGNPYTGQFILLRDR
ncbi:hypothetical protein [Microbacterium sp. T2.11-28]|uniref:hypothetical protein n=1 Tax=unclassified Microbacterium TaxID=2609290 RepID=UPI002477A4CF|nr:hypothetical protein [Microbacterium sp. T2.11-28]CAI9388592.1 hypothetical protein MICABA_03096 [Microbacterium sp. T2.11-28]